MFDVKCTVSIKNKYRFSRMDAGPPLCTKLVPIVGIFKCEESSEFYDI